MMKKKRVMFETTPGTEAGDSSADGSVGTVYTTLD